jgi:hypothetical protein
MRTDLSRSGIQLASKGRWENAFTADFTSADAVNDWITTADKDVAIEALYCDGTGALQGFIGFRRCLERSDDRRAFWLKALESSKAFKDRNPKDDMTAWLDLIGQPSLLDTPPDGIELGIFNQWHSSGPIALHSDRLTREDFATGPDWIRQGSTAPICREHFWRKPERIWVAEVVSRQERGRFVMDSNLLPK